MIGEGPNLGGNLGDGRGADGRFQKGHRHSVGNRGNTHRRKLMETITEGDIERCIEVCRDVLERGEKDGDRLKAAQEILDRACGKPASSDFLERIEELERLVRELVGVTE